MKSQLTVFWNVIFKFFLWLLVLCSVWEFFVYAKDLKRCCVSSSRSSRCSRFYMEAVAMLVLTSALFCGLLKGCGFALAVWVYTCQLGLCLFSSSGASLMFYLLTVNYWKVCVVVCGCVTDCPKTWCCEAIINIKSFLVIYNFNDTRQTQFWQFVG